MMPDGLHERIDRLEPNEARRVLHVLLEEEHCESIAIAAALSRIEREQQARRRNWFP
jgi:hypothetical protein